MRLRTLFLSCLSFSAPCRLFSMVCGLFLQNRGGMGACAREETSVMRPVSVLILLALSTLSTTLAPSAEAWGCRGHETVAVLAEKHLDPQAKQALLALLAANPIDPQLKRYCGQTGQDAFADR